MDMAFRREVVKRDRDPLRRILREALRIKKTIDGETMCLQNEDGEQEDDGPTIKKEIQVKLKLLNSKREFFLPDMPTGEVMNVRKKL